MHGGDDCDDTAFDHIFLSWLVCSRHPALVESYILETGTGR
jgi:hypothetical protein